MHGSTKKGTKYSLLNRPVDIEDTSYRSEYFVISDLNPTLTAGKNMFTINGSNKLKPRSGILLEILDSKGGVLYYETAKSGYFSYADTTDLVVSIHIYESTPSGFGKVVLMGTTVDGKVVRWNTNIKINPTLDNSSKVTFFNTPSVETEEFLSLILNESISSGSQTIETINGSVKGYSLFPKIYTDIHSIDIRKTDLDYRLSYTDTSSAIDLNSFNLQNKDREIELYISEISYLDNNVLKNKVVNITESFFVDGVTNTTELQLDRPFTYYINNTTQIVPIVSASFTQTLNSSTYLTSSGLITSSLNPDGVPDPTIYLSQRVDGEDLFLKEAFLDITYKNLKTLTGKVHRHKVYRRSLNKASEFECIADEPLIEKEFIFDSSTINRFYANIGEFYEQNHIAKYYYTSSADLTLTQSSITHLNSMICNSTDVNLNQSRYIIIKNDTSLVTSLTSSASYVDFNANSFANKTGSSYDSNFIKLYKNTDYLFSSNVDIVKNNPVSESRLLFYLTGSYNTSTATVEQNYINGKGLLLKEYNLPIGTNLKSFTKDDFNLLNFINDYIGTIVIIPVNISQFRIDNLSLTSHAEFGFSPDTFFTRISFPVSIKNEQFEIKVEFLDINNNSIYSGIRKIVNMDRNGETLAKNIPNFVTADTGTIINALASGSGKLTLSSSRDSSQSFTVDRATLSVIESFVVQKDNSSGNAFFVVESTDTEDYCRVDGKLYMTGSIYMSPSERLYGTSSYSISASQSNSSSYLNYGVSNNHVTQFTASSFDGAARTASGYIPINLNGSTVYIPYFTAIS